MSTTPQNPLLARSRSTSRTRTHLPSRPTTPLRPPSRSSLRASQSATFEAAIAAASSSGGISVGATQSHALDTLEPGFAELADGLADLEANMLHLQLMHESVARFAESFAAFLFGLNMNAFCVDFVEAPVAESFARGESLGEGAGGGSGDPDATFL
jgi:DASH complex subunit DAM1